MLLKKEQPEGMLLDIHLGSRLDGFDILSRTQVLSRCTKVIMMTAVSDFEAVEKARRLGAVDYVTKPFTLDYLEDTVQTKIAQLMEFA